MTGKTVVVLGGSVGGLGVAHRLLKHTLPKHQELQVILVSRNSHFYWNVAAVRAIIPDILRDEELLQPIAPGLEQYNTARHPSAATFIHGSAKSINTSAKSVEIELAEAGGATIRTVAYDHLVIATGSRSAVPGMPWKAEASYEDVVASIHRTADRVKAAEHIVVAGGGATGVEVSCELRYEFPGKQVVLLSADETLVGGDRVGPALEQALASMGVVLRKGAKAVGSTEKYGKTEVELANGETISTDLYLPTVGMIPNSEWIPDELLDERRLVKVDDCMKVTEAENVWAVGDVVGKPNPGYLMTEAQATCAAQNIDHILNGKSPERRGSVMDIFIFSTGRSRGVGRYHSIPLPSMAVWIAKSRTLGVERTPKFVNGSMW